MINKRTIEWMNEELDAETSATKSARLYRHLEKDPEAQAYFDDLKKLNSILEEVTPVEPPATLRPGILSAIRATVLPAPKRASIIESVLRRFSSPALPRYGFAVASGICIGMLIFAVITGDIESGTQPDQVAGTIGAPSAPTGTVTDYGVFESATMTSSVEAVSSGLRVFVETEIRGEGAFELRLVYPADAYSMTGIRRQTGVLESITSGDGVIQGRIHGPGRVLIELNRTGIMTPPVQIELHQGPDVIWEKSLITVPVE